MPPAWARHDAAAAEQGGASDPVLRRCRHRLALPGMSGSAFPAGGKPRFHRIGRLGRRRVFVRPGRVNWDRRPPTIWGGGPADGDPVREPRSPGPLAADGCGCARTGSDGVPIVPDAGDRPRIGPAPPGRGRYPASGCPWTDRRVRRRDVLTRRSAVWRSVVERPLEVATGHALRDRIPCSGYRTPCRAAEAAAMGVPAGSWTTAAGGRRGRGPPSRSTARPRGHAGAGPPGGGDLGRFDSDRCETLADSAHAERRAQGHAAGRTPARCRVDGIDRLGGRLGSASLARHVRT